jgi:hypothetical protein
MIFLITLIWKYDLFGFNKKNPEERVEKLQESVYTLPNFHRDMEE